MGIFKILPLMCLLGGTVIAIRVPLCRSRHGQEEGSAGSNENCLCATGYPTIINKIDAEHFGVERLVIYVYRKPNTDEIISFIPEREYQRRFPDFPEDYGIVEDISYNPSILDIFVNSPSKDVREYTGNDGPAPIPQPNQPDVIDVKPNDVDIDNEHPQVQELDIINPHWQLPVTVEDIEIPNRPTPSDDESAEIVNPETEPGTEYETIDAPIDNSQEESPTDLTPVYENAEPNPFEENPITEIPVINPVHPHASPIHPAPQDSQEERYPPVINPVHPHASPIHPAPQDSQEERYPPVINPVHPHASPIHPAPQNPQEERYPPVINPVHPHASPIHPAPQDSQEERYPPVINPVHPHASPIHPAPQNPQEERYPPVINPVHPHASPIHPAPQDSQEERYPPVINPVHPHASPIHPAPQNPQEERYPPVINPVHPHASPIHPAPQNPQEERYPPVINPVHPHASPIHPAPQDPQEERYPPVINPVHPHASPIHPAPQDPEEERYPDGETSGEAEPNRDGEQNSSESPIIHTEPLNPAEHPQVPYDSVEDDRGGYAPSNIVPSAKRLRVPIRDKYGRIIGWTTHVSNTYREKGRHIPPFIKYDPSSHFDIEGKGVPSFDYWLKQQLKFTTLHGNRVPTSTSDIVALHTAIRNLLLQNGFVVTRHGTLTDGYGKVTSLTNLKLRPIFIGKSVSYDHFMQGGGVKFKIPTDTPFLEGLLLTMIKPAKILGIVPLKITSLPDELSPEHKDKKFTIHGNPVGQKASFKVLPIEDLVSFRKDSKGKNRPRPLTTKILHKYRDSALLQQALSEISKPETGIISEEKPDFRIIGGASATSSGTPLLFKGRSGNMK